MRKRIAAFAALLIALVCAAAARATTLRPMDLAELAREAGAIVHGRVVLVRPEWARGGRQIDSLVTLEVLGSFKGEPPSRISFVSPGGQIGDYVSVVPGAPQFAPGAEVVLFLAPSGPERTPAVVGLGQGVLPVVSDAFGEKRVRVPLLVPGLAEPHLPLRLSLTLPELAEQLARIQASAGSRR